MAARSPGIPAQERLFSLVLALLASEHGLSKSDILSTVQGYRQRYDSSGGNQSLERQFERDKDDLRELGIPIETTEPPGEQGNNQLLRYRIPRGEYELPTELTFTPEEMAVLSLAGTVWREGALSSQSQRALLKLRSLGAHTAQTPISYAPRVSIAEDSFAPLSSALDRKRLAEFRYLKPGRLDAEVRRVAPLALVQHHGRWHLYAHDASADAPRTFLLSRIVGPVRELTTAHTWPLDGAAAAALEGLDRLWERQEAVIVASEGSDARLRLGARAHADDDGTLRVHYTDGELLADELAGYGPDIVVHSPASLVDAVRLRLGRVRALHSAGAGSTQRPGAPAASEQRGDR
ncbi:MAG: helix-turn-helix transcriptional regulator [Mycetocola reblochoni]|uniref:WYL domain-containing protein n=2 Tax=Mycetocola reblochoni TaxID=331618 RepID=A0A3L6ZNU6_9MICO|nr:WYL domain-containing protein [Mycetocola reblochoni]RLP69589.1 WYL domain-containing protein [Mycetocola reblochoni]SJN27435.1 Putative DeoR-family transcriptional regulator [Mycetocola reblochoni REB411]